MRSECLYIGFKQHSSLQVNRYGSGDSSSVLQDKVLHHDMEQKWQIMVKKCDICICKDRSEALHLDETLHQQRLLHLLYYNTT